MRELIELIELAELAKKVDHDTKIYKYHSNKDFDPLSSFDLTRDNKVVSLMIEIGQNKV